MTDPGPALRQWLADVLRTEYAGDLPRLAADVGYDESPLHKWLADKYEGSAANVTDAVARFRSHRVYRQTELIETLVTRRIREWLDYAENTRLSGVVFGPTGWSKTMTAAHWCAQAPRRIYVQVPVQCSLARFVRLLARAAGLDTDGVSTDRLQDVLLDVGTRHGLSKRLTLVIDEAGELCRFSSRNSAGLGPIGLVKDIVDVVGCGVVLVMQAHHWSEITGGSRSHLYAQLVGRLGWRLGMPQRGAFRDEVAEIARVLVPDAGRDLLQLLYEVGAEPERLRVLFTDLKAAAAVADEQHRVVTASDVRNARASRRAPSDPKATRFWPQE